MKFIGTSYSLYTKDIHRIWCRSAKFCENQNSVQDQNLDQEFYFRFQYQTYISYIEDTHQILFGSANSFESYCVHMNSPRTYSQTDIQTYKQTDGNFFWLVLSSKTYKSWTFVKRREFFFFTFSSHTEYVKRESIVIAWVKKQFSPFGNFHDLYVLEDQTSKKKFRLSICLSVCLDVRTYVDFSCGHNNFWRS